MSGTTRAVALAGGLGLFLGAGAFWLASGPRGRAPASAASQETPSAVAKDDRPAAAPLLAAAALRAAIRDEVRAAVHDEATALNKGEPAPEPVAKEPAPPTPSYEKAQAHLTERLAQGSWSKTDRERMQEMLRDMTDVERSEVMRKVIVAANKGELRVQVTGPLF